MDLKLYKECHQEKSTERKKQEAKAYATLYSLKIDNTYLYAFREHDTRGCGVFNKTICYESGKCYKDWHCDMRANVKDSFGFDIWPKGNTSVKIKIEDWGVAVSEVSRKDGKVRVRGFEII